MQMIDHLASVITLVGFPLILFGLIDLYRERKLSMWRVRKWVGISLLILGSAAWAADVADRLRFIELSTWGFSPDTGPIVWNFAETAAGHGYFLEMQKTGDKEINVVGFGAVGKNISSEPIEDFRGYLRSDVTNETLPFYILAANAGAVRACTIVVPTPPKDTLGIPAFSRVAIATHEKPLYLNIPYPDAIPATKFKSEFAPFTIIIKYDGKEYQRHFSRDEVDQQIAMFQKAAGPPVRPYVIRKKSAPPPPLTPLIQPKALAPLNPDLTGTVLEKK